MRRLLFVALFAILTPVAHADVVCTNFVGACGAGGALPLGGGTITGPINLPNGSATAPSWGFASDDDGTGTGFYRSAANQPSITINGVESYRINATTFSMLNNAAVFRMGAAADLLWGREAAATWEQGTDLNGAAIAQMIKSCDGITGTDIAGCDRLFAGGRGTGAGAGGNVGLKTSPALATGTTAQTLADRELFVAKAKALTAGAATSFIQVAVASGTVVGGVVEYTIEANDGTDYQSRAGVLVFHAVNKAGTETCTLTRPGGSATVDNTTDGVAVSSGTLTNTFTCSTSPTNAVDIQANAASSLVETTLRISYSIRLNGGTGLVTAQ